jgi:mitotic spindle assembly checkpoint protein MAD2
MPSSKPESSEKAQTHKLALRGSSKLVTEFFEYSINSILFQRGVYPPEDFSAYARQGKLGI